MNIKNAVFTDDTNSIISVEIDGVTMSVPADKGNRHYQMLLAAKTTPAKYVAPPQPPAQPKPKTGLADPTTQALIAVLAELTGRTKSEVQAKVAAKLSGY